MSIPSSHLALKASFEYELSNFHPPQQVREYLESRVAFLNDDETVTGDFEEYIEYKREDADINVSFLLEKRVNVRTG